MLSSLRYPKSYNASRQTHTAHTNLFSCDRDEPYEGSMIKQHALYANSADDFRNDGNDRRTIVKSVSEWPLIEATKGMSHLTRCRLSGQKEHFPLLSLSPHGTPSSQFSPEGFGEAKRQDLDGQLLQGPRVTSDPNQE